MSIILYTIDMKFDIELVGKIGSMALIDTFNHDIDYNKLSRIGRELTPGMIWVSSGAVEIGRIDYVKRNGAVLDGSDDDIKTDYAAQGQAILMKLYRDFISSQYSVRQVLVEHRHFNNDVLKTHIKKFLLRCPAQNAVPIINYNDAVSFEENRKMEIRKLREHSSAVVELIDNDETAAQIACLVKTKRLVILTNLDGIYRDPSDPSSLITRISGSSDIEVIQNIEECKNLCHGASRVGANGAAAKLEFVKEPIKYGTTAYIANAKYSLKDIIEGNVPCTRIGINL